MKKKYYAVKKGRKIGIYNTWDECKEQTNGFTGAVFKSFMTIEEAQEYLDRNSENREIECEAVCYTDGSFDLYSKRFSYGVVMFYNNEELHFCEAFSDIKLVRMRNVAGEIRGAAFAMQYALDNNIKSIEICYDYEGVEKWCNGEWKANKPGTIDYLNFYKSISDRLFVKFTKVVGHSGNKYNDLADSLAKSALGIKTNN